MKQLIATCLTLLISHLYGQVPTLIFHSGFEPNTDIIGQTSSGADIVGTDNTFTIKNNWVTDLEGPPNNCQFGIQYQGGNDTMRLAEIAPDPLNPTNNVLHFRLNYPNVSPGQKGRVQGNLYFCSPGFQSLYYSVRLFLPTDLDTLKFVPAEVKWFTLLEFWNNPGWLDPLNGFRISVDLQKIGLSPDSLRFGVRGQLYNPALGYYDSTLWETTNMNFAVPTGKWMTIKINFIEGDSTTGRFYIAVIPDGDTATVLWNINNYTHHPNDTSPDGLTHHNPFKLYTSAPLIDSLREWGRLTHVYWDDYELWSDSIITTGLNEASLNVSYQIYPNPTDNEITILFDNPNNEPHVLTIYDILGRPVLTSAKIIENKITVYTSNLTCGLYFFQLRTDSQIRFTGKLIIK